jgi:hypothetical protein
MSTTAATITPVVVGTRLHCILYGGRNGTVFAIHGQQRPETIRSLFGGTGCTGGAATFDIVFDDGSTSKRIPEAIARGVQWRIFPDVWGESRIAEALAHAEDVAAAKAAAAAAEKAAFAAEVARLTTDPEWSHLTQCSKGGYERDGKLVGANIRTELKKRFPGVKFSVRKRDYSSICVSWVDGPTTSQVDDVVFPFKGGRFDSSQDLSSFENSPFIAVYGGVQYLSTTREFSNALIERAIDLVCSDYAGNLTETKRPTYEDFRNGRLWSVPVPLIAQDMQTLIYAALSKMAG